MAARAKATAGLGRAPRMLSIGAPPGHASAGGPLIHAFPDAAEDERAAEDARFEVAAAEEQERSAEERSAEEQERERVRNLIHFPSFTTGENPSLSSDAATAPRPAHMTIACQMHCAWLKLLSLGLSGGSVPCSFVHKLSTFTFHAST